MPWSPLIRQTAMRIGFFKARKKSCIPKTNIIHRKDTCPARRHDN
jgi:hypothetical protein